MKRPSSLLLLALSASSIPLLLTTPCHAIQSSSSRIPDVLKRIQHQKNEQQKLKLLEQKKKDVDSTKNSLASQQFFEVELEQLLDQQQQQGQQQQQQQSDANDDDDDVQTLYYEQTLDHFSQDSKDDGETNKEEETFRQRYFYSGRYVHSNDDSNSNSKNKAIAFLCIGGEGPSLTTAVLVNSVHCTGDMIGLAAKLHAEEGLDVHLFALEHRFYGESFPKTAEEEDAAENRRRNVHLRGAEDNRYDENEDDEDEDQDGEEELTVDYTHLSSRQAVQDIVQFVQSP
eukprot:CAMPEP_0183706090 /NCGR_PEP_ID=MMETSP0737-20130205/3006_1 /TAXON_ID=385413 /ORGANISM="Thalassiosira miniscula, Strain CCMP1093" /LENGTH=285 /DNA_ID=CAMNT_0025933399 /DNA_START=10 /DNA_END=863 /DNA_ORIENTATION=+